MTKNNKLPIDKTFMAKVYGVHDGEYPIGEATSLELLGALLDEVKTPKREDTPTFDVIKMRIAMDGNNYTTEGSWADITTFMGKLLSLTEKPQALPA